MEKVETKQIQNVRNIETFKWDTNDDAVPIIEDMEGEYRINRETGGLLNTGGNYLTSLFD